MESLCARFPAPAVMGIVNVTPDSFSDGGRFLLPDAAVAHGERLVAEGADVVDVGGESTRPGSLSVGPDEELRRVLPVIGRLRERVAAPISIDTMKAAVAREALAAGASFVNDVTALRHDPEMAEVVARARVPVCLMHMLGEPRTMQEDPRYDDVVEEVRAFLAERAAYAESAGIRREQICVDPGIGFGKTTEHNLALLSNLNRLADLGYPLLIGVSRKRFLCVLTGGVPAGRLVGTLAANAAAFARGAWMFRVHDVAENRWALAVSSAIASARRG